jgi:DNA-binding transcriptional LysR family regulator
VELDQVEAFVTIVRKGGFTRAAAALHLSQPAVSRRVRLLEHAVGAPLFERSPSGGVLTDAGRAFLPPAEALLAAMRDARDAVASLQAADRGAVTLALVGTLAGSSLTAALRRFRDAHPGVDLRLRTALSTEVSALVRRGDATLGLRYGVDPHPDLLSTTLHDEPLVPVCAPHHRLARARRVRPAALAGERWITFPPPAGGGVEPSAAAVERSLAASGMPPGERVLIDSLTAQKRMVEAGFGLALLQASSVDEELRAGTLAVLPIPALRATVPIVLIQRRRAFLSGAARAVLAVLSSWPGARSRGARAARPAHAGVSRSRPSR